MMNKTNPITLNLRNARKVVVLSLLLSGTINFEIQAKEALDYFTEYADAAVVISFALSGVAYYGYKWMYPAKKQEISQEQGEVESHVESLSLKNIAEKRSKQEQLVQSHQAIQELVAQAPTLITAENLASVTAATPILIVPEYDDVKSADWRALAEHRQEKLEKNRSNTLRAIRDHHLDANL